MEQVKRELLEDEVTLRLAYLKLKILMMQQQLGVCEEEEEQLPKPQILLDETDYDCSKVRNNNNILEERTEALETRIREKRHKLITAAYDTLKKDHKYKLVTQGRHVYFPSVSKFIFDINVKEENKLDPPPLPYPGKCQLRGTSRSRRRVPHPRDAGADPERPRAFVQLHPDDARHRRHQHAIRADLRRADGAVHGAGRRVPSVDPGRTASSCSKIREERAGRT